MMYAMNSKKWECLSGLGCTFPRSYSVLRQYRIFERVSWSKLVMPVSKLTTALKMTPQAN